MRKTICRLSGFGNIKKNNVKNVGKSYVTEQGAGIFTDYIGKVFKEMLASDLVKAHAIIVFCQMVVQRPL